MKKTIRIEGVIKSYKTYRAKLKGDAVAMVSLATKDREYEIVVLPDLFKKLASLIEEGSKVVIHGYWHSLLGLPGTEVFITENIATTK